MTRTRRRRFEVIEELRQDRDLDRCSICDHRRSDHIDDLVEGQPVGCVNLSCYYYDESRHRFVAVESLPQWVEISRTEI